MKSIAILALFLGLTASASEAATLVSFTGNTNGAAATGTASISLDAGGNSISGTLTNTSPFDASITGFGFDIGAGNLAGFTGTPMLITTPAGVNFAFQDGDLGNVPQFSTVVLDFGYLTGANFAGGSPNDGLGTAESLEFMISGSFAGLSEEQVASALLVRLQNVGADGELSDVATTGSPAGGPTPFTTAPEPASMLLLGSGLLYLARRQLRSAKR